MNGREETSLKYEKRSQELLTHCPYYFTTYYNTLYDLTSSTKYRYLKYILEFIDYLELDCHIDVGVIDFVKEVKPSLIRGYIATLNGLSGSIKAARLHGIKKFFNYCLDDDIIERNPFDRIKMPKDDNEHIITALTRDEIQVILNNINDGISVRSRTKHREEWIARDIAMFKLDVFLGLRVTSLTEINLDDLDMENNMVTVREKGGKERTLEFDNNLKNDLLTWIVYRREILEAKDLYDTTSALFISDRLNRISTTAVANMLKRVTYNIDKHISPHKLRSTCATIILEETSDITIAAEVLGHADLRNTQRYARVSEESKRKAISAMSSILYNNTKN